MVTKARQERIAPKALERQTWAGDELTFNVHGLTSTSKITLYPDRYFEDFELFKQLEGRKDIDVDFSAVKTLEEGQSLREKFEATLDKPDPQDYPKTAEELDKADYRQTCASYIKDIARSITYDLANASEAKVSKERYSSIVNYAKELVQALAENKSIYELHEPNRTPLQALADRIMYRDTMRNTKEAIESRKRLLLSAEDDKTLHDLSKNIPYTRINSRIIHDKDADPVCNAFMDIYEKNARQAMADYSIAVQNFKRAFVRLKVYTDALRTFDQKLQQHLSKLNTIQKVAQKQKEKEQLKKQRKIQNRKEGKKLAAQQKRQALLNKKLTRMMD